MPVTLPCLPLIEERFHNAIKEYLDKEEDMFSPKYELVVFLQNWKHTALSLNGIRDTTFAYTTVIWEKHTKWSGVFLENKLAYLVKKPNKAFFQDMDRREMEGIMNFERYTRKEEE